VVFANKDAINKYIWLFDFVIFVYLCKDFTFYVRKIIIGELYPLVLDELFYKLKIFFVILAILIITFLIKEIYYFWKFKEDRKKRKLILILFYSFVGLVANSLLFLFIYSSFNYVEDLSTVTPIMIK
jgi:hypothetical protein